MSRRHRFQPRATSPRSAARAVAVPPLYHFSVRLFATFSVAMVIAFWPSYFSRLLSQPTHHQHAHGIVMMLWLALLVAQAVLIRGGQRATHRRLGLVSYALVPLIVVMTARFVHYSLQPVPDLTGYPLFFLALVLNTLVVFVVLFALAMVNRRQPAVHARFIVSTLFPLFTPVTDRLIGRFMPWVARLVPTLDGSPLVQVAGFLLADAILAALAVWDWRANNRRVFAVALGLVVVYQTTVLTFHRFAFWQAFGAWYMALPVS